MLNAAIFRVHQAEVTEAEEGVLALLDATGLFAGELPKTATGKIQRFRLRDLEKQAV